MKIAARKREVKHMKFIFKTCLELILYLLKNNDTKGAIEVIEKVLTNDCK
jgi:hypothetical protein